MNKISANNCSFLTEPDGRPLGASKYWPKGADDYPQAPAQFPWKYNEYRLITELTTYLMGTYGEHYVSGDGKIQEFDVMEADGELEVFAKQSARKYLRRYGKKQGRNRKDLLKVLHYTVILLYLLDKDDINII